MAKKDKVKDKASKKKGFVYRGANRTVESVARASKAFANQFDRWLNGEDLQIFKPRDGENNIRILPPTWDDQEKYGDGWHIFVDLHYRVGADNTTYLCLRKMKDEPCPICEARDASEDEEERDNLRVNRRALVWLIDRDNEKAGPQLWPMPLTLFREINTRSVDKKSNKPILIDDPDNGYDISFVKEGKEVHSKYIGVEIDRDPTPLSKNDSKQERWLEIIENNPLPDLLQFYEYDHIEKVLHGKIAKKSSDDEDDDDVVDDEDETPRRRRKRSDDADEAPRKRKRLKDEDEELDDADDEEEELDVDDEDEEDDDLPSKRRASKSKSRDDDEEDDDDADEEDEDEDEEDDEPRSSSRKSSKGRRRDDDDEDEDDDENEDDEDETEEEDEDEDEDEESDEDEDDEDSEDDEDDEDSEEDEDEDDEPRSKSKAKLSKETVASRAKARLNDLKKRRKK